MEELLNDELKEINGGSLTEDIWYGIGYLAGLAANGLEELGRNSQWAAASAAY